ncbi:MAG: hypothetical protein M3O50_22390 [Myxococcota bacterium]|nr:hypothetical protein [Myxococcota bacterium]
MPTLRDYNAVLRARHLGGRDDLRRDDVAARVAEAERLESAGRVDDVITLLTELVEHPRFELFEDIEEGRAAVYRLGDALATAGIDEPARAYLRRVLRTHGAWQGGAIWARRAVRRLVDIAIADEQYADVTRDLESVPRERPEDVRGEIAYVEGRAREAAADADGALRSYALVTQRCRFWAQATYLSALIDVERGRHAEAEALLCRVADPKRSATTTPVFADEKFFAVRDLSRLGLGRIAHEDGRNDDARYYYYLVPRDSDRLAEALYEAATTRYEKKDYNGARDLLDELSALRLHHRYEDEAWLLDAWVDLARCRFADADKKLMEFLARYEPVRDSARRIAEDGAATRRLIAAVSAGSDTRTALSDGSDIAGTLPEVIRAVAAVVRVDPQYDRIVHRRSVLEREASGLVHARAAIEDMQRALAADGGVRPAIDAHASAMPGSDEALLALDAIERPIGDLVAAHAPVDTVASLRRALDELRSRFSVVMSSNVASVAAPVAPAADLPDLLVADAVAARTLAARLARERDSLRDTEAALAKDALVRLDRRLSRLLRRARLGRIESVLGRKRALEADVEAIRLGQIPQDAVDSLDVARYLEDREEYWPFEGDDWPDEYIGRETK